MPFQPPKGAPDFSRLRVYLVNSGMQTKNNALYQTIDLLIQWLEKLVANEEDAISSLAPDLSGLVAIITQLLQSDYLTWTDETLFLPNSRQLVAGTGITFDDSVAGQREINSSAGGSQYIPLVTGAELPGPQIMSDGAGKLMLVKVTLP